MKTLFIVAATCASLIGTAASAQTVANGSFELGTNPGSFTTVSSGDSTTITGWTVTNGTVDYIGSYFPAQNGSRSIDLSGSGPGTLSQLISGLTSGTAYSVLFYLGSNNNGAPVAKTLNVSAAGQTQGFTFTPPTGTTLPQFSGYSPFTFTFTANAPTTTLSFVSTTNSPYGPVLDNVSIFTAVPEAASWVMMIGGFGLAGTAMRRRRKAAGAAFA